MKHQRQLSGSVARTALLIALITALLSGCTGSAERSVAARRAVETADAAWTALPDAPLPGGPRMGTATVWTGQQIITWGGGQVDFRCLGVPAHADGAAYHPATATWTPLPASPLSPRIYPRAQWAGRQLILIGGDQRSFIPDSSYGCQGGPLLDGAAYEPATATWRTLPPTPLPAGAAVIATAWTGTELLVWAGRDGAAAFDPQSWTWRALPAAPEPSGLPRPDEAPVDAFQPEVQTRADSVWTGDRWLIWASVLDADHDAAAWPLAYDPAAQTWSAITAAPVGSQGHYWDGQQVLALFDEERAGYQRDPVQADRSPSQPARPSVSVQAYDVVTDTWTPGPRAPEDLQWAFDGLTAVADGRLVTWQVGVRGPEGCAGDGGAGVSCAQEVTPVTYVYDARADEASRWQALAAGPWESWTTSDAVDTGDGLLLIGQDAGLRKGGSLLAAGPALPAARLVLP